MWYPYTPDVLSAVTRHPIKGSVTALFPHMYYRTVTRLSQQPSQSVENSLKALARIAKIPQ